MPILFLVLAQITKLSAPPTASWGPDGLAQRLGISRAAHQAMLAGQISAREGLMLAL